MQSTSDISLKAFFSGLFTLILVNAIFIEFFQPMYGMAHETDTEKVITLYMARVVTSIMIVGLPIIFLPSLKAKKRKTLIATAALTLFELFITAHNLNRSW